MGTLTERMVVYAVQDSRCEPEAGDPVRLRLLSTPSTLAGPGTARRALQATPGPLQLLRRERQLSQFAVARRGYEAALVQVAVPSQPTQTPGVGASRGPAPRHAASATPDHRADLGVMTTRHVNGGAGWARGPRPDLARAPAGRLAGATLQLRNRVSIR